MNMGHETSKASRLASRQALYDKYIQPCTNGIDIGCGLDPLELPKRSVIRFDKENGDAQHLMSPRYSDLHFVYASHVLEHMESPVIALVNWSTLVKYGGHMIIVVPEFVLYERRQWPSPFNSDHKARFSMFADVTEEVYTVDRMVRLHSCLELVHAALETDRYDFSLLQSRFLIDQTAADACANIVYVFRKK